MPKLQITHRYTGKVIYEAEAESLRALVIAAVNDAKTALRGAYLRGADLEGAYLEGAYLEGAKGINKYFTSPLYGLLDQPGPIRAYKLVTGNSQGPFKGGITYEIGATYEEADADTDEAAQCSSGLHVATLDWVMREWRQGYRILVVEHTAADIACVPLGTDGKYRLRKLTVVGEKSLEELGLVKAEKAEVKA